MLGEIPFRCAVTILFGVSITMYAYLAVAQRDRWVCRVSHLLHLVMSVAMILMVWRVGLNLPAIGPMLFFLLAGVWFALVAVRSASPSRQRLKTWYYAAMMAAMAWMYAVMSGGIHSRVHSRPDSAMMDMPGMQLPAQHTPSGATTLGWVAAANWVGVAGFGAVALYWSYRFVGGRHMTVAPAARLARMEPVYQAFTAAGTALMFDALAW